MCPPTELDEAFNSLFHWRVARLTGERQTTLVPEARSVSQEDMTIRPVIDYLFLTINMYSPLSEFLSTRTPTSFLTIHGASFSFSK